MLIMHGSYEIDDDSRRLDVDAIHAFLARDAYWSPGIPRDVLSRAIAGSLNFGLYRDGSQVGFARVVSASDAHQIYADCGFVSLSDPQRWMTISTPAEDLYRTT